MPPFAGQRSLEGPKAMTSQQPASAQSPAPISPEDHAGAILNIEDSSEEKAGLSDTERAMLNLLEDFDMERFKTEAANRDLRQSLESLRLAKEATEAAYREIEAFSYSVSHDLRAPLRAIAGFSQLLLEDYSDKVDDEGKDSLNRIVAAAEKMGGS